VRERALGGEADDAHLEAAGRAAGATAREKEVVGASGAWADASDRRGVQTFALELKTKNRTQIEVRLTWAYSTRPIFGTRTMTRGVAMRVTYGFIGTSTVIRNLAGEIRGRGWMGRGSFVGVAATGAGVGGGAGDFAGKSFGEDGVHLETAKAD
jgi:hypothetical protein